MKLANWYSYKVVALVLILAIPAYGKVNWNTRLQTEVVKISKKFPGEIGLYVKDLQTGKTYSMNADTQWYLASLVKVPVLIEVMRQRLQDKFSLKQKVKILKSDYVDGPGKTNWIEPNKEAFVYFLIQQMMEASDNTATDKLIDLVGGVGNVNQTLKQMVPEHQFGPITTLLEVRHLAYGEIHKKASSISNMSYIEIKKAGSASKKFEKFKEIAKVSDSQLNASNLKQAFERYYSKNFNSSSLVSFGALMEKLATGQILGPEMSKLILGIMNQCKTGKKRMRKTLPKDALFAEKTGTQLWRACDAGVITFKPNLKPRKVVVVACLKNHNSTRLANKTFQDLGRALSVAFNK